MAAAGFPRSTLLSQTDERTLIREAIRSYAQVPGDLPHTLSAISGELARYDAEISQLQAQLKDVKDDRLALQTYYNECISLKAPIRRLPVEILAEIFTFCDSPSAAQLAGLRDEDVVSINAALSLLAHAPLLSASQVCARWHEIVIGTPKLWGTIHLDGVLWATPARTEKMMDVLQAVLQRGGNRPLSVTVMGCGIQPHPPALELLAAHSERWQLVRLAGMVFDLRSLSAAKGKLPRLQTLSVWGELQCLDVFDCAPLLDVAEFGCTPLCWSELSTLPVNQLLSLLCLEPVGYPATTGLGLLPSLNILPHLQPSAEFRLRLALCNPHQSWEDPVSRITSNISTFSVEFDHGFSPANVGPACAKLIDSLTLPGLDLLEIGSDQFPHPTLPVPWPQAEFLALAARSEFHTHLKALHLWHVAVTEADLLACLAALPALERLAISDHQCGAEDASEHLLVTDSLFAALTSKPDTPSLVPRLGSFGCQSLLKFDDNVYLDFLLSWVQPGEEFGMDIWWLPGHYRELDSRIRKAVSRWHDFEFSFEPAEGDI
ncbi:hypothetical protein C8R47DRAFT_608140 [Mycena vitilis]|nr:hypothetical protein C8R47DRAFT_608140 [Mycena vitilis]